MSDKTQVAAMDSGQKNSPIISPDAEETTLVMEPGANACFWNGVEYPEGTHVESQGVSFECGFGRWVQNS